MKYPWHRRTEKCGFAYFAKGSRCISDRESRIISVYFLSIWNHLVYSSPKGRWKQPSSQDLCWKVSLYSTFPTELIFCSHVIVYFAILSRMRGNHSQVDLRPINCLGLTGIREFLKELASKKRLLYLVSYQDLVSKMDWPSDRKKFTYSSGPCQRIKQKNEQNCKCSLKLFLKFNGQIPLLFDKKFLLQLSFYIPQSDD